MGAVWTLSRLWVPVPSLGPGTEDTAVDQRVWAWGPQILEKQGLGRGHAWCKLGMGGGELALGPRFRDSQGRDLGLPQGWD